MNGAWEYRVYDRQQLVYSSEAPGPVELGRQDKGEEGPYSYRQLTGLWRFIVAPFVEDHISRRHVLVEPQSNGRLKITNLSRSLPLRLENAPALKPLATWETLPPVVLVLGHKTVRIQAVQAEAAPLHSLAQATLPPGQNDRSAGLAFPLTPQGQGRSLEVERIGRWLQTTLGVLQSAASSPDFFARAARAVVDLVGLDAGGVLLRDQGNWKIQAQEFATGLGGSEHGQPSRQILGKVLEEKRTFWEVPAAAQLGASLQGVKAVVAAPILNRNGEVLGALYGDRRQERAQAALQPIAPLEAMLVEVLAGGVAAGLARLEQEQAALRARVQLEQFFTPELSRHLLANADLLHCRETAVTLLVADIRGFSRIAERLGPDRTGEWIGDTLGVLSECVRDQQGVLVDYTGDEVLAMWGAPLPQPDHARLACRAGLAMLDVLPVLNERWQGIVNEPTRVGIGINTGLARVGNVGSKVKFKYGPMGNPVNLASRVQGATKYLRTRLLITQDTQAQLGPGFATRRLGQVRVLNLVQPVALFELAGDAAPAWSALKQRYEEALAKFESKDFEQATRLLGQVLADHPQDGPSLMLMARAIHYLEEPASFDPVWELPGK